jgi:hypothetical protein
VYEHYAGVKRINGPKWWLSVMPNPAPEAERLAGGVEGDAAPAAAARTGSGRARRVAVIAAFAVLVVVLFDAYLHLSKTYAENSDEANILLMAKDMLHGNLFLSGWYVSDVPFISTELPQIALLVWIFGLHLNTAHIAAAVTYTLIVVVGMLLAKGKNRGQKAIARMAIALAIMIAPQPGFGVFVLIFSVGHIGAALPVLLTWLVLDRFGQPAPGETAAASLKRRWWVPIVIAVMIGWALMADPLVLVIAIFPLLVVCLARVITGLVAGVRDAGSIRGIRQGLLDRWLEFALAAAAGLGYLLVAWGRQLLSNAGGYHQHPVPYQLDAGIGRWFMQARVVTHGLLEMFGAYFAPGKAINYLSPVQGYLYNSDLSGFDEAIAITHLVGVLLVIWGACAIARRFFFRDADFISQLLLVGIVANLAAYIPSTLADHTALNTREIAPVLPFAAVLAGRMLGDRLLTGPLATVRLPAINLPVVRRPLFAADAAADGGATAGRSVQVRVIAAAFAVLLGWYGYGLFREASVPAAPNPYATLEAFLEANHLNYGLGGYWQSSVITVDTGGAVTVRAVAGACMQPYSWEAKQEWYDPGQHVANFLVLSNAAGYFNKYTEAIPVLNTLNAWNYPDSKPVYLHDGGMIPFSKVTKNKDGSTTVTMVPVNVYEVRVYPVNLLTQFQPLYAALNNPLPSPQFPHPKQGVCVPKA